MEEQNNIENIKIKLQKAIDNTERMLSQQSDNIMSLLIADIAVKDKVIKEMSNLQTLSWGLQSLYDSKSTLDSLEDDNQLALNLDSEL